MIPKIIHYVWLGGAEPSDEIKRCIESWRTVMPNYEIKRWDESCLPEVDSEFVREAIAQRKWAFASDVIRLYALYKYGGIYLDTDVMVHKRYDDLLANKAFVGRENSLHLAGRRTINYVTTCCMASEPGNEFIARCLHYYDGRRFVTSTDTTLPAELRMDMRLNSEVVCRLAEDIGYNPSVLADRTQDCGMLVVYPTDFFDPCGRTANSYCTHLALGTWREGKKRVWTYSWRYKIQWRLWSVVEALLRRFDRIIIKLT